MSEITATDAGKEPSQPELKQYVEASIGNALPHYLPLGIFPLIFLALIYGGWWLLPPFLFMSVAGPADKLLGPDERNINPKSTPEKSLIWHNLPVWTWAILWPPLLIFGMWQILVANPFAIWEQVILVIILTMEAQAVFVVGHELVHRRTSWERRIAEFLLASGSYPQYATEHVYVHHAKVGTPNDAGSAPKGESFWRYFPKEVASNITNSWATVRDRLARSHHSVWHYTNPFWRYGLGLSFWYGITFWMGGIWAVLVYIALGFGCVFSMKMINYCQHYGLRRVRLPNGRWERAMPRHSWDADWKFSNWMFFKMQRHSDHHAMASRHYPLLQVSGADEAPQMPGTYQDMMNLVLRPKKWFEKMDPLVDQWRARFYPEIEDWRAYDSPLAAARPESFDAIIELYNHAPRLANRIEQNPELLDNLHDQEFTSLDLPSGFGPDLDYETTARRGLTRLYWTHEMDVQALVDEIAELPAADARDTVEIVRNWSNDKAFQIGVHVLRQNLTPLEGSIALSNLSEAVVTSVMNAVLADIVERNGVVANGGVVAMLVGDLASSEAYPGIHLNLVFVHDDDPRAPISRLIDTCRANLQDVTNNSLVFSPSSNTDNQISVLSLADYRSSCEKADPSNIDLLSRARGIFDYGDPKFKAKLENVRTEILASLQNDEPRLTAFIETLKQSYARTQASNVYLVDEICEIECAAQILRLKNGNGSINDLVLPASSVFQKHDMPTMAQAADLIRSLNGIQKLAIENEPDFAQTGKTVQTLVASACGYETVEALNSAVQESTNQVKQHVEALV